jgi:predicted dehydrogenase
MRVAIAGTGGVADRHLGVLARVPGCRVVGHLSTTRQRADAQAGRWGGRPYTDLAELLERELPEAVWVCVTPDRHGPVEELLIDRDIPMFIEKPLSNDLLTAERIAAKLATKRLVVGVGYKFRALDTLPRVRAMLAERPARLVLGSWHGATPAPPWWRDQARSGGQVVEQATHLVDLARLLVGEPEIIAAAAQHHPRADYPSCTVAQVTAALLRFPDGVPGTLTASCLLQGPLAIQLQLVCDGRALTITERALRIDTGRQTEEVPVAADPFLVEDQVFVRAVHDGNPDAVLCSYADALATHRVAVAIRSAASA